MNTLQNLLTSKTFRLILGTMVLVLIARSAMILLPDCSLLPDLSSPWLPMAILMAFAYRIINAWGWALVLRAMKQEVDGLQATRIWLQAESRRWLPGGVWGYASRALQASQQGVPANIASASMLVELVLTVVAAIILFIPVAVIYRGAFAAALGSFAEYESFAWLGIVTAAAVGLACFMMRKQVASKLRSLKQRVGLLQGIGFNYRKLLAALGFYTVMGCLNGWVTCCLMWSMSPDQCPPVIVIIAATSFAWVVGFLAVFAPGGMLVREATFATCLGLWMPYSTALALAVVARVVQLAAEVAGMLWIWASSRCQIAFARSEQHASLVRLQELQGLEQS